ncbi:capsule assembly Wzi family protein [Carboxylicivirga marina]|uniref:Capsule assembly Wzi family protein n=1 Tax=Carboxylicivirga marina TaxID=2800988 RepID=A0ABS1HPM2_9BACT|nr:capsule assembly Wzi family protein [Carboxylicivirga marina]MBK3519586.1 hypothetical protein [Carboxylicivirga marina]
MRINNSYLVFTLALLMFPIGLSAQEESLKYDVTLHVLGSSNEIRPMWMVNNEWGRFNQFGSSEALAELGASFRVVEKKHLTLNAGLRALANFELSESVLQEAYLSGNFGFVDFSLGKEQYSPLIIDDVLTSGMYLMNSNARPIPRVTIGIFDYLPLGFTKNWVEIKGGILQGWLNDERIEKNNSANNVLLHEKFAYMRLGNTKVKPYAGLVHSALFGGTRPDGTKIPIDFWPTFFGSASSELGETNATGAHMGMWDFGFNWQSGFGDVHLYWQKPFADASGLKLYNWENKDYTIGVLVKPKDISWLSGISIEVFKSDVQSGYGIPDPLYPESYTDESGNTFGQGSIIWMHEIDDFDHFMHTLFPETAETTGWEEEEVVRYLEVELNEGHKYGGRDDYMNNGSYYNGWTYSGVNMGTPLFHTAEKVRKYANTWDEVDQVFFYNNRVNGFHLGAEGCVSPKVKYRIKSTYTLNKGSYAEEFRGRSSWTRTENYFFSKTKHQLYSMLEVRWATPWFDGLFLSGRAAFDTGQLYDSFGGQLSIVYAPSLKK